MFSRTAWLCLFAAASFGAAVDLYVGPAGDDANPGTAAELAFRTPGQALRAAATLRQQDVTVTIRLLPGRYALAEALVIGPELSGKEGSPIVFRAVEKGTVTLDGSRTVAGWQPWRDGIWRAPVDAKAVDTVYWNGERLPAARVPNVDPTHPRTGGLLYAMTDDGEAPKAAVLFAKGELDVSRWQHPETGRLVIWPGKNWNCDILPLAAAQVGRLTTTRNARYEIERGNRFYVEHILEELDAPGEWFFDAKEHQLYLMPPVAGDPGQQVTIPQAANVLRLAGTRETLVHHVVLEGLRIEGSASHAVELTAAWDCTLRACAISRTGKEGVLVQEGSSRNRVVGCDIAWTGTAGIRLHGVRDTSRTRSDGMFGNVVENNHIHHVGMSGNAGGAVDMDPYVGGNITHDNIIRRNEIHDAPRKGIMFGGVNNVVEGNHIHHVNLEQSDTGPIGLCTRDLTERGCIVRHNYLHDVGGYNMLKPGEWAFPSFCWGVYLDDWTSGVQVIGNVIVGGPSGAVHVHSGLDNVIENNVFVASPKAHILLSPIVPPKTQNGQTYTMAGNRIARNVVVGSADSAWLGGTRDWRQGIAECDHNLLWFDGQEPAIRSGNDSVRDWAAWQQAGFDTHSVVAPRNPVSGHYQVDPELAAQIGFEPIPWDQIGLYESPDRFSWPVRTDWPRETPLLNPPIAPLPVVTATAPVPGLTVLPQIDGNLAPDEWQHAQELALTRDHRDKPAKPVSTAWVGYTDQALYLAIDSPISEGKSLQIDGDWGKADALEIALRPAGSAADAPILILHGYLHGRLGGATSGGMTGEEANQASRACQFKAQVQSPTRWTAEIAIPWSAIPGTQGRATPLQFNVTCRKVADNLWLMWRPTGRHSYGVGEEGKLLPQP